MSVCHGIDIWGTLGYFQRPVNQQSQYNQRHKVTSQGRSRRALREITPSESKHFLITWCLLIAWWDRVWLEAYLKGDTKGYGNKRGTKKKKELEKRLSENKSEAAPTWWASGEMHIPLQSILCLPHACTINLIRQHAAPTGRQRERERGEGERGVCRKNNMLRLTDKNKSLLEYTYLWADKNAPAPGETEAKQMRMLERTRHRRASLALANPHAHAWMRNATCFPRKLRKAPVPVQQHPHTHTHTHTVPA